MKSAILVLAIFALGMLPGLQKYQGRLPDAPAAHARHPSEMPPLLAALLTPGRQMPY